ncbi:hypothetical protein SFC65_24185 [Priestia filamentosa]|uniref:hypothetical protein n=1 Tax=Priestia filamentosa TaxID=1402861 RepID=UPI0039825677
MKKAIVGSALCSVILVSGCQAVPHQFTEVVEAQPSKDVKKYEVDYALTATSEQNKVNVEVTLENTNDDSFPLLMENHHLFEVRLEEKDGTLVDKRFIDETERKEILKKEKLNWNVTFEANMDKELIVKTNLLLHSNSTYNIGLPHKEKRASVYVKTKTLDTAPLSYIPMQDKIYTYKPINKEEYTEEVSFFNGNKLQTFSKQNGVTIYAQEPDGIYSLTVPDPYGDIDGTQFVTKDNMDLVIPLPVKQGQTWSKDKKNYRVSDSDVLVKTDMGFFKHCIEITETYKKNTRYYYYQKDIGLVKVKEAREVWPSKTILELTKLEDNRDPDNQKNTLKIDPVSRIRDSILNAIHPN